MQNLILQILTSENDINNILHCISTPLLKVTKEDLELLDNMVTIMLSSKGIGIAANQVGVRKRLIVMLKDGKPIKLINPKIICSSKKLVKSNEGCLSCPGVEKDVMRHEKVEVVYIDENMITRKYTFKGLESFCIQHEIDHLDGKLIID